VLRCDAEYDFETSLLLKNIVLWSVTENNQTASLLCHRHISFAITIAKFTINFTFTIQH